MRSTQDPDKATLITRSDSVRVIAHSIDAGALQDLGREHLWMVYPSGPECALDKLVTVMPGASLPDRAKKLKRKGR